MLLGLVLLVLTDEVVLLQLLLLTIEVNVLMVLNTVILGAWIICTLVPLVVALR